MKQIDLKVISRRVFFDNGVLYVETTGNLVDFDIFVRITKQIKKNTQMTSSSYLLDREMLGSARNIIDVNSNTTFSQQTHLNSYRGSYGTTSFHHHGYTNGNLNDSYEAKKIIADVRSS